MQTREEAEVTRDEVISDAMAWATKAAHCQMTGDTAAEEEAWRRIKEDLDLAERLP
jgi:hypothetical protein